MSKKDQEFKEAKELVDINIQINIALNELRKTVGLPPQPIGEPLTKK